MPSDFPSQFDSFPDYLSGNPNQNLQAFQGQIGKYFNTKPIQAAGNQYIQSNFDQQRASAAAMAAAAQHRAMQSGGAVGASFAQAGALLPVYNQRNQQSLDIAKIMAQMKQAQAGLMGQTAGMMDNNALQRAGQQSSYGMGQQKMASDNAQFDQTMGLQRDEFGLQQRQFNANIYGRMLQQSPRFDYTNSNLPGMGLKTTSNQQQQQGDNWMQRLAALQY